MVFVFFISAIVFFAIQNIFFKLFSQYFMKNLASFFLFNTISSSILVGIIFILYPNPQSVETPSVLLGVLFGLAYIGAILLYMKAMECGPTSYTALIYSFGLLIPILFGLVLWKEKINLLQIIGMILLFLTFYLGSNSTNASHQKVNLKWVFLIIGAAILNGSIMVLFKEQQILTPGRGIHEFLMIAYVTSSLLSLLLFLRYRFIAKENIKHLNNKRFILIVLVTGVVTAGGSLVNLYLCKVVSAVILFPILNGGIVLFVSLVSFTMFKEKFGIKNATSIILGIGALFLLSI